MNAQLIQDIVSSTEGGAILGVTRQRFEKLAASDQTFPKPVARLGEAGRRVWSGPAVAEYAARRRSGRSPRSRRHNPTVTAQLAEAWRLAQSAAATAERVHLTTELTAAAAAEPSEEHRQAVAAAKADWQDKITQAAHAKLVYTAHVQAVLTPGSGEPVL